MIIECNKHTSESCLNCKYYEQCELILPWTPKTLQKTQKIQEQIHYYHHKKKSCENLFSDARKLLKEYKTNSLKRVIAGYSDINQIRNEITNLNHEIRLLRKEEHRILKQLRIKRDRRIK